MGLFKQSIVLATLVGQEERTLDAWVDTGSTYTWVPRSILIGLGIEPTDSWEFILADGSTITRPVAPARIRLLERQVYVYCVFAEDGTEPLLGAVALEEAGLAADPVNRRLIPAPRYALTAVTKLI